MFLNFIVFNRDKKTNQSLHVSRNRS